jgi:AcrR family transcriptional regulator
MEVIEETKKQQILHTAMDVFKEKGYFSASMKDIAEACGMAKGSIYKIFPSKEDLFTEVFEACHQMMFEQARELDRQQENLLPKEKFQRKIEFQLQYMFENYFFTSEFKELPIKDNEKFILVWKKKRATLLTWHKDCFFEAYGDCIESYIWDVVAIFRGLQKEYLSYAIQKVIALPMSELAHFFVERMDAVVNDMVRTKPTPVLKETSIYFNDLNPIDLQTQKETVRDFLQSFSLKIRELQKPETIRQELLEVISLLQKEIELEAPNKTLLHVFITFLETITELRPYVRQLVLMI